MVQRYVFDRRIPPRYILNVDETPFGGDVSITSPSRVVTSVLKQGKTVIPSTPRHANFTITLTITLDSGSFPAQLIWPSVTIPDEFNQFDPLLLKVYANSSGYQDQQTFYSYMTQDVLPHILNIRRACKEDAIPIIVFLDGHSSRFTDCFKDYCSANNITPILFPPHTTHLVQVLDQHINSSLKELYSHYLHTLEGYAFEDPSTVPYGIPNYNSLSKESIYRLKFAWSISRALRDTLTARNITDAWKESGIYSLATMNQKIQELDPGNGVFDFHEEDYLLRERTSTRLRKGNQPKTEGSSKAHAKKMKPDKKPTSKPSVKRLSVSKVHAKEIREEAHRESGIKTIITRSGRRGTGYDWSVMMDKKDRMEATEDSFE